MPIKIENLDEHARIIEETLNKDITNVNLYEFKDKLIDAKSDIVQLMHKIITVFSDYSFLKTDIDKGLYAFLKEDAGGFLGILDEKQTQLLESLDGTAGEKSGISRTSAFKSTLKEAFYGVIWNSLKYSSDEYINFDETDIIKREPNTFLRIFFLIFSINISLAGGLPRRKSMGLPGLAQSGSRVFTPSSWKAMFTKDGEESIKEEYKERFGGDLPELEEEDDFTSPEIPEKEDEEDDTMVS